MLKLTNVSTRIGGFPAVREISLEIPQGDFVTILGSNGAGKTTLFRTIAGVLKPFQGTIEFKGQPIQHLPANKVVRRGLIPLPGGPPAFSPALGIKKSDPRGVHPPPGRNGIPAILGTGLRPFSHSQGAARPARGNLQRGGAADAGHRPVSDVQTRSAIAG